jgi:hypothetical protein
MSSQRFTNAFREALWDTYGHKCFYCNGELPLSAMQVDHLLPEALTEDSKALSEIRKRIGLDDSFCITGFENLVPSCSSCNNKKSGLILPPGSIAIFAAIILQRLPALEAALEKKRSERELDTTLRFIARAIENGTYTSEQLLAGLRALEQFPDGILGHAPGAPVPSPEWPKYGVFSEEHQIIFTEHALERIKERDITVIDVTQALQRSIQRGDVSVLRSAESEKAYVVRGDRNLRIVYRLEETQVVVTSVMWKE